MKNLAKFSVNRAITIFMAVIIVVVFGVVSYTNLTTDLFPSMNIPYSVVVTTYPGASHLEVEEVVTDPIESALATTTNVKDVSSVSYENYSLIILEFNTDTNMDSAVIEMRETLDMTTSNMPDMVGSPMIIKLNPDMMPIMQVSVYHEEYEDADLANYIEDELLPQLERVPGVASVSVNGAYEGELAVEIRDEDLAAINAQIVGINEDLADLEGFIGQLVQIPLMDKEMLSNILMAQNFDFPLGYANVDGVDHLVRIGDEFATIDEIQELTVFNFEGYPGVVDGLNFKVKDIADVYEVNANASDYSKVNGNEAISLTIQKSSDFATTDVTNEINTILNNFAASDENFEFYMLLDQGEYIEQATGSVSDNLLYGAILAIIVLFVFLRSARATLIVGVSIPISLMFAIVLIYFTGITLNIVSLGGLALGIGMLVDNSIVVMENIFRMKKLGYSNKEAAIEGTKQVSGAIFASTITTISVFVPVVFIEGFIREIFIQMALTITYSLVASLLIALTLVPAISSRVLKEDGTKDGRDEKNLSKIKNAYEKTLNFAFRFKYIVLALVFVLFGGSVALALTNGFEYFPASDEGQLSVSVSIPTVSPLLDEEVDPVTEAEFFLLLDEIDDSLLAIDEVEFVGVTLGSAQGSFMGFSSSTTATVNVDLKEDRARTTLEVEGIIRDLFETEYSELDYEISGAQMQTEMLTGSGFQVQLRGHDLDTLKEEADKLVALFSAVEGVATVDNGVGVPSQEIKITIDREKAIQYGYMTAIVGEMIAEQLAQEDVTTNVRLGDDLVDVYVYDGLSNTDDKEYSIEYFENLVLGKSFDGSEDILLKDVAKSIEPVSGFRSINHSNGVRTLTVSATFDDDINASFVAADLNEVMDNYNAPDGYSYEIQGENEEIMEALNTLGLAVLLAIALIYMIMASQFQSYTYPLIIMVTIPLAFTGGFLILWLTGMPVSVVAMIGFIILVGVVVNNGIVFVDYTNQLRDEGLEVEEALIEAGKTRLRPIVMTALTTILALITMAIGVGQGAEMMQPMAVTTIGGMLYATILTLLVVPIMYYLMTKHGRLVISIVVMVITALAAVIAYYYLAVWYVFAISGVVILLLLVNLIFNKKQAGDVVE